MKAIAAYGAFMASILLSIPPAQGGLTHGTDVVWTWASMAGSHLGLRDVPCQTGDRERHILWATRSVTSGPLTLLAGAGQTEGTRDRRTWMLGALPGESVFNVDTMADPDCHAQPGIPTLNYTDGNSKAGSWRTSESRWDTGRGNRIRMTAQSIPAPEAVVLAGLCTSIIGWLRRPRLT
jgi:hypothetical protein